MAGLNAFELVPSDTNTFMFRHTSLSADEFALALTGKGILVSNLNGVSGIKNRHFLRMTIRNSEDNSVFVKACEHINSLP